MELSSEECNNSKTVFNIQREIITIITDTKKEPLVENYLRNLV
jgi:hypothetical protein